MTKTPNEMTNNPANPLETTTEYNSVKSYAVEGNQQHLDKLEALLTSVLKGKSK